MFMVRVLIDMKIAKWQGFFLLYYSVIQFLKRLSVYSASQTNAWSMLKVFWLLTEEQFFCVVTHPYQKITVCV